MGWLPGRILPRYNPQDTLGLVQPFTFTTGWGGIMNRTDQSEVVQKWLSSSDPFPVDFEEFWPLLYRNRQSGTKIFKSAAERFKWIDRVDYKSSRIRIGSEEKKTRPKNRKRLAATYLMTLGSFCQLLSQTRGPVGREMLEKIKRRQSEIFRPQKQIRKPRGPYKPREPRELVNTSADSAAEPNAPGLSFFRMLLRRIFA